MDAPYENIESPLIRDLIHKLVETARKENCNVFIGYCASSPPLMVAATRDKMKVDVLTTNVQDGSQFSPRALLHHSRCIAS